MENMVSTEGEINYAHILVGIGIGSNNYTCFTFAFFAGIKLSEAAGLNRWIHAPVVRFGPDVPTNIVVYYVIGTNRGEMEQFEDSQLFKTPSDGHGKNFKPGIGTFLRIVPSQAHGHDGFAIGLDPLVQRGQRNALVASLMGSPLVFKVYTDIAPAAIPDSDSKANDH